MALVIGKAVESYHVVAFYDFAGYGNPDPRFSPPPGQKKT